MELAFRLIFMFAMLVCVMWIVRSVVEAIIEFKKEQLLEKKVIEWYPYVLALMAESPEPLGTDDVFGYIYAHDPSLGGPGVLASADVAEAVRELMLRKIWVRSLKSRTMLEGYRLTDYGREHLFFLEAQGKRPKVVR